MSKQPVRRTNGLLTRASGVGRWIALGLAGAAVAAIGGVGTVTCGKYLWSLVHQPPPPLAQQLDTIIATASRRGKRLVYNASVDMRGSGGMERILVFSPLFAGPPGNLRSDELRVYENVHGRLRERYRFEPTERERFEGRTYLWSYSLSVLSLKDINGDRGSELIVDVKQEYADALVSRPVLIYWDAGSGRYRLLPILGAKPIRLVRFPHHPGQQVGYQRVAHVFNAANPRQRYRSIGAEHVEVIQASGVGARLAALFVVSELSRAQPLKLQVGFWTLDTAYVYPPTAYSCLEGRAVPGTPKPVVVDIRDPRSYDQDVRNAYKEHRAAYGC